MCFFFAVLQECVILSYFHRFYHLPLILYYCRAFYWVYLEIFLAYCVTPQHGSTFFSSLIKTILKLKKNILLSFAVTFKFINFTTTFDNKHIIQHSLYSSLDSHFCKTLSFISSLINSSALNCLAGTFAEMAHLVSQISNQDVTASKLLRSCH